MPDLTSAWGRENLDIVGIHHFTPTIIKVGPKGYIHGWIFVGPQAVGSRVFHPQHGHGRVAHVKDGQARVHFDGGKKHTFDTSKTPKKPHRAAAPEAAFVKKPKEPSAPTRKPSKLPKEPSAKAPKAPKAPESDLAAKTPLEIDSQLAELSLKQQEIKKRIKSVNTDIHHIAGDKQDRWARGKPWGMSDQEALDRTREAAADATDYQKRERANQAIDRLEQYEAALALLWAEENRLDSEHKRRPWSRFFLVTSSAGHIHKSMDCSTCNKKTEFGWLPNLSGKSEADAVAEHGPALCTTCFPTAPVKWTSGTTKKPK